MTTNHITFGAGAFTRHPCNANRNANRNANSMKVPYRASKKPVGGGLFAQFEKEREERRKRARRLVNKIKDRCRTRPPSKEKRYKKPSWVRAKLPVPRCKTDLENLLNGEDPLKGFM